MEERFKPEGPLLHLRSHQELDVEVVVIGKSLGRVWLYLGSPFHGLGHWPGPALPSSAQNSQSRVVSVQTPSCQLPALDAGGMAVTWEKGQLVPPAEPPSPDPSLLCAPGVWWLCSGRGTSVVLSLRPPLS